MENTKKTLFEKLQTIQSELKAPKGQKNNFGNYKYRSCEDILEAVKPLLKEQNAILTLKDEIVNIGNRFYVKATAVLSDGDVKTWFETTAFAREAEAKKGMDESQITGAASSYARKYALNGLFCIDDTKDADTYEKQATPAQKTFAKKAEMKPLDQLKRILVERGAKNEQEALEKLEIATGVKPKKFAEMTTEEITNNLQVINSQPF